jgi:glycosyltransferase involved in cell wall biosynthesis
VALTSSPGAKAASPLEQRPLPFVSVVVPVRNEERYIFDCLAALRAQDYPRERFEVIVVDGLSTDGTAAALEQARTRFGLPDRVLVNERQRTSAARNLGVAQARGDVVVFVDGHTRVDPGFLSASVRALAESGADAVGGPIRTEGRSAAGEAIALAMSSPFGVGDAAFRHAHSEQWTDSVAFGAYRRDVFERVGGFADVDRGEDDEFNYRLRDAGGRIVLSPEIRSTYYCRESFDALARQYWFYGLAKASVLQHHPQRLRPRHLVPSAVVALLFGGLLFGGTMKPLGKLAGLAGFAYAGANAFATFRLAREHRREARYLPLAFACIHLPAGAGMIVGFAKGLIGPTKPDAHA